MPAPGTGLSARLAPASAPRISDRAAHRRRRDTSARDCTARRGGGGVILGMLVGDAAEIIERAKIVAVDAIAIGIHPAEPPLCNRMPALGGVLQGRQRVRRGH